MQIFLGTVPVTINWQADSLEKVNYKISVTDSKALFIDERTPDVQALIYKNPSLQVHNVSEIHKTEPLKDFLKYLNSLEFFITPASIRCIIFTSGTTGNPKGVELSYENYRINALTFEQFLNLQDPAVCFCPIIVNPLHHTNSTSMTDWALRRQGTTLHLFERYFTQYWKVLASVIMDCPIENVNKNMNIEDALALLVTRSSAMPRLKYVLPLVSRHIDFLEALSDTEAIDVPSEVLKLCLERSILLLGSAPVGPTTISRLLKYANNLPTVRFGSTETTLQVSGIPLSISRVEVMKAFERGWLHQWDGVLTPGYYIGREHRQLTEVLIVRSVTPKCTPSCPSSSFGTTDQDLYMQPCVEGQPGYIVTRGGNIMSSYVHNESEAGLPSTVPITLDGWYVNLGDIGFFLRSELDGGLDLYWQSRDSQMLIRGGANYAYEQVNAELHSFVCEHYVLDRKSISVAVCGLRVKSEHEDECCVLIELLDDVAKEKEENIVETFMIATKGSGAVSKGARPDRFRIGTIPMIASKGIIDIPSLINMWKDLP